MEFLPPPSPPPHAGTAVLVPPLACFPASSTTLALPMTRRKATQSPCTHTRQSKPRLQSIVLSPAARRTTLMRLPCPPVSPLRGSTARPSLVTGLSLSSSREEDPSLVITSIPLPDCPPRGLSSAIRETVTESAPVWSPGPPLLEEFSSRPARPRPHRLSGHWVIIHWLLPWDGHDGYAVLDACRTRRLCCDISLMSRHDALFVSQLMLSTPHLLCYAFLIRLRCPRGPILYYYLLPSIVGCVCCTNSQ